MFYRIHCCTLFDITATGVRSHYKESRIPFHDETGQLIQDQLNWTRSRNQQRNWETINQLISLRTLPENISTPIYNTSTLAWEFEFDVVNIESISLNDNLVGGLLRDCVGVPMILGLTEKSEIGNILTTAGPEINIWFTVFKS
jgi:hypothetical protein